MRSRRNCERFPSREALAHDDGLAWCFGNSTDSQPKTQGDEDMKSNFIIAAMAALAVSMATMLATIGPANANETNMGNGCSDSYRVPHRNSGCLHAWWDNTPPWSSGVPGGSTVGVQSDCSEYGKVVANPTSPTQRELCRFSLFSTTQVIELLESCTPNSPQYCL